ncbi:hypothetical protein QJS10_CPB21g01716 [Acorus calamus]|uniref:Uncharacterized protein n=1 Tax=Acorus calamus TaxID=4465 RepID=A0AAV9C4Q0_ACOCL|nr:hypothetical protein QJS10_CPB21g01716 [Acorus calamus]
MYVSNEFFIKMYGAGWLSCAHVSGVFRVVAQLEDVLRWAPVRAVIIPFCFFFVLVLVGVLFV